MTHNDLVKKAAKAADLPIATVDRAIDMALVVIADELRTTGEVNIKGIGKLRRVLRPARPGRNPRTGEPVLIPESQGVKFKRSKLLEL